MFLKTLCLAATVATSLVGFTATADASGGVDVIGERIISSGLGRKTFLTHAPNDYTRLFILEKNGQIRIYNLKTETLLPTDFLDIDSIVDSASNEQGLLGLAFHPDYENNGYFYVNFTNNGNDTEIRRYQVTSNPNIATTSGSIRIMTIDQPFTNHNGGWIGFGPDGYLYVATGDGGSANDPGNRSQDITNQLLGKMLRIDVDGDDFPKDSNKNYAIPADNPYNGFPGDDEIYAIGLRNPWRCSFDKATGDLYIADVGQGSREEINVRPATDGTAINWGWRCMEGNLCTGLSGCTCFSSALRAPIQVYSHASGRCSITGGYVYRGCRIPSETGNYFYSDYCSSNIWSLKWDGGGGITDFADRTSDLDPPNTNIGNVSSFGEDAWGELYILEDFGSEVFKIVPNGVDFSWSDFDCDGDVDVDDLLFLLANWGDDRVGNKADVDGDDDVDVDDLLATLGDWG